MRQGSLIGLLTVTMAVVATGSPNPSVDPDLRRVAAARALPSDFNGDGIEDLAIGVPWDQTYGWENTGGSQIIYGSAPDQPTLTRFFGTKTEGVKPLLRQFPTLMGSRMASADFDGDGFADLAMSVPGFDEPDPDLQRINVGGVVVVYGTPDGLDPLSTQAAEVISQDSPGVQGVSEDDDDFGSALAPGDFDGDGFIDLAIGAIGERTGPNTANSGAVTVVYGGRNGLTGRDQVMTQDSPGILNFAERYDWAGGSLAAADFDADGVDDLALGVFSEGVWGKNNAGAVNVIYGKDGVGLTGSGDQFIHQGLEEVPGRARPNGLFGAAMTTGDFDGNGIADLAVAAPEAPFEGVDGAGVFTVVPGSTTGLQLSASTGYTPRSIPGSTPSIGGHFGAALAAGDVNLDGFDELAVTTRSGDVRVDVLSGSPAGPAVSGATTLWPQDFVLGEPASVVGFGTSLQFGAFDATPGDDLAISAPWSAVAWDGTQRNYAGAIVRVFTRSGSLDRTTYEWWSQASTGVDGDPDTWERFGYSLPGSAYYSYQ